MPDFELDQSRVLFGGVSPFNFPAPDQTVVAWVVPSRLYFYRPSVKPVDFHRVLPTNPMYETRKSYFDYLLLWRSLCKTQCGNYTCSRDVGTTAVVVVVVVLTLTL